MTDDMGFRFHKSLKLLPGVRINFGKTGTSMSIGGKGMTTNISNKGVRNTVSLPGTGLSYTTYERANTGTPSAASGSGGVIWLVVLGGFVALGVIALLFK